MKIYTKMGDNGTTGTFKGCRVNKDTLLVEAIGTVDELNSTLGLALSFVQKKSSHKKIVDRLYQIQKDLFAVGAVLAGKHTNLEFRTKNLEQKVGDFEKEIDGMCGKLPELHNFVIPGGTSLAATLFLARAICRRTERRVVGLLCRQRRHQPDENAIILKYLNRLSDYLFVLARYVNYLEREKEIVWAG